MQKTGVCIPDRHRGIGEPTLNSPSINCETEIKVKAKSSNSAKQIVFIGGSKNRAILFRCLGDFISKGYKPGYAVTEVILTTAEGDETVTPVDGRFNFAIQEPTTITVTAAVVKNESHVSYTAAYENGTVSATVNGEPFAETGTTFSSDAELIFTAAPAEGYALKEWKVTDGSSEDKIYAAAGNSFTFHAYAAQHHVSAVFVPMEEVAKKVTLNIGTGGTIIVKEGDRVLTPNGAGEIIVPKGTTLTFEAVADQFYGLKAWTGIFAKYKNDIMSISLKIDNDVTVGAVFGSFLAYQLFYDTESQDGGTGSLKAETSGIAVSSGSMLTPGVNVDLKATAGPDSRIQKWTVTQNGVTSYENLDTQGIVTQDTYPLTIAANSKVTATFKTIEKYDLTGTAFDGNGTVTVLRGGSPVSRGDDVLRYYDDLTITLTPNKGYVIKEQPSLEGTDTYTYTVDNVVDDVAVDYTWEELEKYAVTYAVVDTAGNGNGTHGTLSAAAERKGMALYEDNAPSVVYEGGTITFTAKPDNGYRVMEWKVNGKVQSETGNTLTLTPMEDLNVTVQYTSELPKVRFADPAHGKLTAKMGEYPIQSGAAVADAVTFTVVPDENYEVKCWTVNGVEQTGETGNTFTYKASGDCTVAVELWGKAQQVTLQTGTGGTAAATDPARYGETITITATPQTGYVVNTIAVSGEADALYENTGKENGVQTAQYKITAGTTFEITFAKKPAVTFSAVNGSLTADGIADGAAAERKSGDYVDFGSTVTFTASPNKGYTLEGWYVNGAKIEHTDLTYTTDAISSNVSVEARFAAISDIAVTYGVNDTAMGTITATAGGKSFQSGDTLSGGQQIVFTVRPAEGYRVKAWTGLPNDAVISNDKTTATISVLTAGEWSVMAELEAIPQYTVTIKETTNGSITAEANGRPLSSGDTVPDGTQVSFTAKADAYWRLKQWTDDASGTDKTVTLTVSSHITVGAEFTEAIMYDVVYSVIGGNGSATGNGEGEPIVAGVTAQFAGGSKLEFTAFPDNGYMVKEWTINKEVVAGNLSNTLIIDPLDATTSVTVEFEQYQGFALPTNGQNYTVTIDKRNPADTGAPENEIRRGGDVTFTVAPNADYALKSVTVAQQDATITPNSDGTVTVAIRNVQEEIDLTVETLEGIPLTIETAENGTVTVTRKGVALANGVKVIAGDELVITGRPNSGYRLRTLTVNGKSFSSGASYTVAEADSALTVAAAFEVQPSGGGSSGGNIGGGAGGGSSAENPGSIVIEDEDTPLADAWINPFIDVHEADWFFENVKYVHQRRMMNGTSANTFTPGGASTRAMLWTILARMDGETISGAGWAEQARTWAVSTGVSDGTNPNGAVTREQLVTMLYRYAQMKGKDVSVGADTNILSYADADKISEYAVSAMQWACGAGIVNGVTADTIAPQAGATRAQMAAMLQRYSELM